MRRALMGYLQLSGGAAEPPLRLPQPGAVLPIGRAHVRSAAAAMFVSRQQCTLELVAEGGREARLVHTGTGNPTLVIRADQGQQQMLRTGDSVTLHPGDAIRLVATQPSEALTLVWAEGGQQPLQQQTQPQQAQPQQAQPQQPVRPAAPPARAVVAAAASSGPAPPPPPAVAQAPAPAAKQPHPAGPVMLCLVGVPGSGKSTFSLQLAAASGRAWRRVNQDTISKGGTRGTRQQCLAAAKAALAAGCNVIIDRCNVDAAQRSEFVLVAAAAAAPVHCLHLHLPTRVCIKRAGERVNHEGGVSARDAPRVVNTMASQLNKAGPPAAAEGFTSITVAASDAAVAAQLQRWAAAPVGIATPQEQAAAAAAAAVAGQNGGQERPAKRQKSNEPAPGAAAAAAGGGAAGTQQLQQQTPTKQQHAAAAGGGGGAAAGASPVGTGGSSSGGRNAFSMLMAGAKQQAAAGSSKQAGGSIPPRPQQHQQHFGGGGGWSGALTQIAATPDRFRAEASIWHVDDRLVGLLDKYPKSSTHALLLSRQPALDRVTQLTAEHVPLLQHMRATALRFIEQQQEQQHQQVQQEQQHQQVQQQQEQQAPSAAGGDASSTTSIPPSWRVGFHSVPSMAQLHLHILSDDFDSEWLKTKKHWNSYTSAFFLPLDDVLAGLQRGQPVVVDPSAAEALLKQALACHRCGAALANMPKLKQHIASCAAAQT